MNQDDLIGYIALGVIVICVIALIVLMIKKIISKIKGDSSEKTQKKQKIKKVKEKKPKKEKPVKKNKAKKGNIQVDIPKQDQDYVDSEIIESELEEDDDEVTVLMRKSAPGVTIQLVSDTTGDMYKAYCEEQIIIGRKKECDIQLVGDKSVSGKHCMIRNNGNGELSVLDMGSSNGTYLNDSLLSEEKKLESGDTLEIGRIRYSVQIVGE